MKTGKETIAKQKIISRYLEMSDIPLSRVQRP